MSRIASLALAGALALAPLAALADAKVEGQWHLDVTATIAAVKATGKVPDQDLAKMQADLGQIGKDFSLTFAGAKLRAATGQDVINCDWSWGKDGEVLPSKCLDQTGKANDMDPAHEAIRLVGSNLHLIDKDAGLALVFRRG